MGHLLNLAHPFTLPLRLQENLVVPDAEKAQTHDRPISRVYKIDSMAKQRVKAQHYVPRTYLKHFADEERIWIFDKVQRRSFQNSISNVAQERFFYDVGEDDPQNPGQIVYPEEQPVEEMFGRIEQEYNAQIAGLLANPAKGIPASSLAYLAKFVTAQELRTRESREGAAQLARASSWAYFNVEMHNAFSEADRKDAKLIIPEVDETKAHLISILNPNLWQEMQRALVNHIWILGTNMTPRLLHTSDHPVVKRSSLGEGFESNNGIASPGIEIFVPISPKLILMIFERSHKHAIPAKHLQSVELDEDNIKYFNDLQTVMSYRQIFSVDESFDDTFQRVNEFPWCADPNRKRVEISGGPFGKYEPS